MLWFRIDNRLVHGQVVEAWIPHLRASVLVVANDQLAADPIRQEIMALAIPQDLAFVCCRVTELAAVLASIQHRDPHAHIMILLASCPDAQLALQSGCSMTSVNIGNLHDGPGKHQVCAHVCLSEEDRDCLLFLQEQGVALDFRCVPSKPTTVRL